MESPVTIDDMRSSEAVQLEACPSDSPSLKKMENVPGKEGIYASLDQFNEGRIIVHDLGLTLLPGSQIQTKGEHHVEAAAPSEQDVARGEEQGNGAVHDASRTAGESQRTFVLATGINVQPGDLARRSVRGHAVLGRHALKRKGRNGRKGTAGTPHSSEEDDESLTDDENARRGANWISKKMLSHKKRRITRDVTSSAGAVGSSNSQVLTRRMRVCRDESLVQRSALPGIVKGTQLAADRNARKSAACMPALQPPTFPLASSRQSRSASFYVSDSSTDSEVSTSTTDSGLEIYAGTQRVTVAQKTSLIPKLQPKTYSGPTGNCSRSPIVEDLQNYSHQVSLAATGSESRYRGDHPRPALAKALGPALLTLYSVSAASKLQRPSHSARGLNSCSSPNLEQSQNCSHNLTNLIRETSSSSQLSKYTRALLTAKHRSVFRPPSPAVDSNKSESSGTAKVYCHRRRAYSTSDIPTTKEACRTPLSSRLSKASASATSTSSTDRSFGKSNSSSFRPQARLTSSAMSFNYGYSDEVQGSANPYAVTDSTLDASFIPATSAYEMTPLPSGLNTNTPLHTGVYPHSNPEYGNASWSGNVSLRHNPYHNTLERSTPTVFPNEESNRSSLIPSLRHDPYHNTFENSTPTGFSNEESNRPTLIPSGSGTRRSGGQIGVANTDRIWPQPLNQNDTANVSTRADFTFNGSSFLPQDSPAIGNRRFTAESNIPCTGPIWSPPNNRSDIACNSNRAQFLNDQFSACSQVPPAFGNPRSTGQFEPPVANPPWPQPLNQTRIIDSSTGAGFPNSGLSFPSHNSPAFANRQITRQTDIQATDYMRQQHYGQNRMGNNSSHAEFPGHDLSFHSLANPAIDDRRLSRKINISAANSMRSQPYDQNVLVQPFASRDAAYHFGNPYNAQPPYAAGGHMSRSSSSGYGSSSLPQTPFTPGIVSHHSQDGRPTYHSSNSNLHYPTQPSPADTTSALHNPMGTRSSYSEFIPYSDTTTSIATDAGAHQMSPPSQGPQVRMTTRTQSQTVPQVDAAIGQICANIVSRQSDDEDICKYVLGFVKSFPLPGEDPQPTEKLLSQAMTARLDGMRAHAKSYKSKLNSSQQRFKREVAKKDQEILQKSQEIDRLQQKNEILEDFRRRHPLPQPKPAAAVIDDHLGRMEAAVAGNAQVAVDLTGENAAPAPAVTNEREPDWLTGFNPRAKNPRLSVHGEPTPHEQRLLSGPQLGHSQAAANAAPPAPVNSGSGRGRSEAVGKKEALLAARKAKYKALNEKRAAEKAGEERRKAGEEEEQRAAEEAAKAQEGAEQRAREWEEWEETAGAAFEDLLSGRGDGEVDAAVESGGKEGGEDLLAADLDEAYARALEAEEAAARGDMEAEEEAEVDVTTQGPADEEEEEESEEE